MLPAPPNKPLNCEAHPVGSIGLDMKRDCQGPIDGLAQLRGSETPIGLLRGICCQILYKSPKCIVASVVTTET